MVSRVFFTLEADGKNAGDNFTADLKQAVGRDLKDANIEVSPPNGYDGPLDYQGFVTVDRPHFNSMIATQGRCLRIQGNTQGKRLRLQNVAFQSEAEYQL
jgi:hypothetical protein